MDAQQPQTIEQWIQEKVAASRFDTFWINFVLAPTVPIHGTIFDSKALDEFNARVTAVIRTMGVDHLVRRVTHDKRVPSCSVLVQFVFAVENARLHQNIERQLSHVAGHVHMSSGMGWYGVTERIVRNQQL
jgi:hypothetical protein